MKEHNMLNCEHYERIYEAFEMDRPFDAKHAVGYRPMGDHKIRVELDDGSKVDYTFIHGYGKYIREQPRSRDDITRTYVHNDFADKLRNLMDRRGFTQLTLSKASGISQATLSNYLRRNEVYSEEAHKDPVNPTIDKIYLLAWALDCDPYELL